MKRKHFVWHHHHHVRTLVLKKNLPTKCVAFCVDGWWLRFEFIDVAKLLYSSHNIIILQPANKATKRKKRLAPQQQNYNIRRYYISKCYYQLLQWWHQSRNEEMEAGCGWWVSLLPPLWHFCPASMAFSSCPLGLHFNNNEQLSRKRISECQWLKVKTEELTKEDA